MNQPKQPMAKSLLGCEVFTILAAFSPLFSELIGNNCPPGSRGAVITYQLRKKG
jgi:hypothetical protein